MTRFAMVAISITLSGLALVGVAGAQTVDAATRFIHVANSYSLTPNVTYLRAAGWDLKLDVYVPSAASARPTLIYFHGGGWTNGTKDSSLFAFLPYLEMGWAVVNVEYRMADVAHAPAAVEDGRCALRWVNQNAKQFNFDLDSVVVTGNSAGGHLALTTGFLTEAAGLDRQCPGDRRRTWTTGELSTRELKVAGVINWYGITDVEDLLNRKPGSSGNFTEAWLGSAPDRATTAKRVSPTTYVRRGLPPVLTIHGSADPVVPYDQATRLHKALDGAGVPNELITIEGGGHGGFKTPEMERAYRAVRAFVKRHRIGEARGESVQR